MYKSYRYYSVVRHIAFFVIEMIAVFLLCIFLTPKCIELWQNYVIIKAWGINCTSDSFLSGLIGIIAGFLFDLIFINRIRRVLRYRLLVCSLTREFNSIINVLQPKIQNSLDMEHFNTLVENAQDIAYGLKNEFEESSENLMFQFCQHSNLEKNIINEWGLRDIVSSADNDSLFINLPRYFAFLDFNSKNNPFREIAFHLHNINGAVIRFNYEDNYNSRLDELKTIMEDIQKFFICTDKNFYKKYCKTLKSKK